MARFTQPTEENIKAWNEWVESRPESIKALAARFDPWTLYKLKSSGHYVTVYSFSENNTLTVNVTADFNVLIHERRVFGIPPEDLEEVDIPDQKGSVLLTNDQVEDNIDALRVMVRPDLWTMGEDGKAVRKH